MAAGLTLVSLGTLQVAPVAQAGTAETWVGNTDANWSTPTNWSTTTPAAGDSLVFGTPGTAGLLLNDDLAAGLSIAGITFSAAATGSYVISGNSITLAGDILNSGTKLQTINDDLILGAIRTVTTTAGGGNVALGGGISGAGGITTAGAGTVSLSGTNTYTGATTVTGGTLALSGSSTTSGIVLVGGTNTTLLVTDAAATGSGVIASNTGVTNAVVQFHINGGGNIALANALGGNSGITTTFDVNNNGDGSTGGVIQLNGSSGASAIGTVTYNITGGNGYSLYIANLRNTAGNAGTTTFNPTTASVSIGNLTGTQAGGTNTWVLGGTAAGNSVVGAITNGGSAGLVSAVTKSNTSTWTLSGANTYTGATTVSAGTLALTGSLSGTNVTVGGGVFSEGATGTVGGAVTITLNSGSASLAGTNAYTGATAVNGGTMTLQGAAGSLTGTSSLALNAGLFVIDNTTAAGGNNNARLKTTAGITLSGGNFLYLGADAASTNSTQSIGAITGVGNSVFTVTAGGANTATVTAASFTHAAGNATSLVNGAGLGSDAAAKSVFLISTAPVLVGTTVALSTGLNAAAKDTQLVPFLVGEAAPTAGGVGTSTGTANTFLTYASGSGLRPLSPVSEFTNNTFVAGNNTYVTVATAAATTTTVNSLVVNGGDVYVGDGVSLTDGSGALLFASTNGIRPAKSTGVLDFGSAEGQVTVNAGVTGTIATAVTQTGGLTKSGAGTLSLTGTNSYTGPTTVAGGTLQFAGSGALSNATGVFVAGGATLRVQDDAAVITHTGVDVTALATGTVTIDVGDNGGGTTGSTVAFGALRNGTAANALVTTFNFTGSDGYLQSYSSLALSGSSGQTTTLNPTTTSVTITGNVTNQETTTGSHFDTLTLGGTSAGNAINGVIADSAIYAGVGQGDTRITKSGTSMWTLNGANTYNGPTVVSGGTLILSATESNSSAGTVQVNATGTLQLGNTTAKNGGMASGLLSLSGGTLQVASANPLTVSNTVSLTASSTIAGGQSLTFGGTLSQTASSTLTNSVTGGNTLTLGAVNIDAVTGTALTLTVAGTGRTTFAGVIQDYSGGVGTSRGALTITNTGVTTLAAANTFGGKITVSAGTLAYAIASSSSATTANSLGESSTAAGNLLLGNGTTLQYVGSGGSEDRLFTINGTAAGHAATLDASGSGAINYTNTGTIAFGTTAQTRTLTLAGTNTGANTLSPVIGNNGTGAVSVTKTGAGTWVLGAAETYTGATTVNAGSLLLGSGAGLSTASVSAASGASFGVAQSVSGSSNTMAGNLVLSAGSKFTMADGFTSTLNVTGTAALGAASLTFDLGGNTIASDKLLVTGAASIATAGGKITIVPLASTGTPAASYTLISATATSTLSTNPFTLANSVVSLNGTPYTLSLTNSAQSVVLNLTAAAGPGQAYWTGQAGPAWTDGLSNFNTTATGTTPIASALTSLTDVYFSNTAPGNPTNLSNTLGADTNINSLNFLAGAAAVTINPGNALTLQAAGAGNVGITNAASNTQTVNAAVVLAAPQTWSNTGTGLLAVGGNVTNGGFLLTLAGSGNIAVGGAISGTGGVTQAGTGTVTLSGANAYTGTTIVNNGTLALSGGNNRLPSTGTVAFDGGNNSVATLDLGGNSQTLSTLTLPSTGLTGGMTVNITGGTLIVNGNSTLSLGPTFTSGTPNTTINMSGLSNFTYSSAANTFRVGFATGSPTLNGTTTISTVTLASGTNTITAANLNLGDNTGSSGGGLSVLHLGTTNTLNATNINVAANGRSSGTIDFAAGLTAPTAVIRGVNGTSAVTAWNVGSVATFQAGVWNATVDLSGGTVDALVTTLNVGAGTASGGRAGTEVGAVTVGATSGQNFTVTTLNLGQLTGTATNGLAAAMSVSGTFTLNSPAGIVNAGTVAFATNTTVDTTANAKTVSGTFSLVAGTLNATAVKLGSQTGGTATASAALIWTTGTIGNLSGTNLAFTAVPISLLTSGPHTFNISGANTGTIDAASPISGANAGITKSGTGTLTVASASTYTGPTLVNAGTLKAGIASVANVSGAFGNNSAVVMANAAGATLDVTGFNTQIGSLSGGGAAGGNVVLGSAALTVGGDNTSPAAYAGSISGAGSLIKTGSGVLTLTGNNGFGGGTTIRGGLLLANNATNSTGSGLVNVGAAGSPGKLGGTGTVGGPVTLTSTGTITGGTSDADPAKAGTLAVAADGTFTAGATYVWKVLAGSGPTAAPAPATSGSGGGYDQLAFGTNTLSFSDVAAAAHQYKLSIVGLQNLTNLPGTGSVSYIYEIIAGNITGLTGGAVTPAGGADVTNYFDLGSTAASATGTFTVQLDPGGLLLADGTSMSMQGLDLVYTPTPEPVVTGVLGLLAMGLSRRPGRRHKRAADATG